MRALVSYLSIRDHDREIIKSISHNMISPQLNIIMAIKFEKRPVLNKFKKYEKRIHVGMGIWTSVCGQSPGEFGLVVANLDQDRNN